MALVAGIDSSTQACKVVVRDADTGRLVREGRAEHPDGTEVAPHHWWNALRAAADDAGGIDDVDAISVAGQQHGMVGIDDDGEVVRPALLWNDTRSAGAAADLTAELGAAYWADAVGIVPVASFTVTKLRWLAEHEPQRAGRVAAVCLPHDWLTWRLSGSPALDDLVTDRSDASGTGYFDGRADTYRRDLLVRALGRDTLLPRVLGPTDIAGWRGGTAIGAGAGDNAAASLSLQAGDDAASGGASASTVVSLGTSGTVFATAGHRATDPTGQVAGFADATGGFLPLVCTLNAARVLDAAARMLGVSLAELSDLALSAPPGAEGITLVPYFEGERTPNLPDATAAVHGLTLANSTPANLARAAVEGMLCGTAAGLDALAAQGVTFDSVRLIGGAARSQAVRRIAPSVFGVPVLVPEPGERVADGAARQAAWTINQTPAPPEWQELSHPPQRYEAPATPDLRDRYLQAAARHVPREG